MSDGKNIAAAGPTGTGYAAAERPERTAWAGMVIFAGVMLIMLGSFHAMMGLVAIFDPGYYMVTQNGLVVSVDYTTWGWTYLILGGVATLAGVGVLAGQMWARITGIVLAVVSAIVNIAFIAAYPVWTTIVVALDVVVVYALAVHGKEAKSYD